MQELKLDKISFALIIISMILVVVGYGFFIQFNGFNQELVDVFASILRTINPAENNNITIDNSGGIYLNEERSIFALYCLSLLASLIALFRLALKQHKYKNVMGFAGLTTLSLALSVGTVYMVVNSGILLDI